MDSNNGFTCYSHCLRVYFNLFVHQHFQSLLSHLTFHGLHKLILTDARLCYFLLFSLLGLVIIGTISFNTCSLIIMCQQVKMAWSKMAWSSVINQCQL